MENMKPEVLLIDLSSLYWQSYHATKDSPQSEAATLTRHSINRCIKESPGALVAIAVDKSRSFRKDLSPDYKANRPEKDAAAINELEKLREGLRDDGFLLWESKGFEADDIIATACHQSVGFGHDVIIASADKDLLQLLDPGHVRALRTHNWKIVTAGDVGAKFGVSPGQLRDWLALVGDSSDNIKGCPGVGEKTATALLVAHRDVDTIYSKLDDMKNGIIHDIGKPATVRNLIEFRDQVMLARDLVTLRYDVPIKFEEIYETREPKHAQKGIDMGDDSFTDIDFEPAKDAKRGEAPKTDFSDDRISSVAKQVQEVFPKSTVVSSLDVPAQTPAEPSTAKVAQPATTASIAAATQATPPVIAEQTPTETKALVQVEYTRALEPQALPAAFKLAQVMYESKLYPQFGSPQAIAAIIIRGRELGLPALASMAAFHMVEGKPSPSADLIAALAERDENCEYLRMVSCSDEESTWETKHKKHPMPTRYTYTIEMARKAGLLEKGNWNRRPQDMCVKTAKSKLSRLVYPMSTMGLISTEEMDNE